MKQVVKITKEDYLNAQSIIQGYAPPMQTALVEWDIPLKDEIWIPMYNATNTGKVMTVIGEFMNEVFTILFEGGTFKRPGIFKLIKVGFLAVKLIKSIVESLKN